MAEQEKQTAEVTAEPEQAQDTLQEYIRYLNQQEVELQTRLEHIRIALEEAAAYDGVRHSGWRQHKENPPHRRQPVTGAWVKNNHTYHTTNGGICQMKTSEVKKMQALSIRRDDAVSDENWFLMMRDIFLGYETAMTLEQAETRKKSKQYLWRCASVDKGNNIAAILEIVRLAMEINESKETEMQVCVEIHPHVSQIFARIFPRGWTVTAHQCSKSYCASYDRIGEYYDKKLFSDEEDTWENIDCDVQRLLQEICEIAESVRGAKSNG